MRERREADDYNENRIAGWAGSQIITIPAGLGAVEVESNLIVQARLATETYLTAQFGVVAQGPVPGGITPRARAEITWTVQGNSTRRLVDIVSGTAISGAARNFNIKVIDNSFFSGALHPDDFRYLLSCQVTPGVRPQLGGGQPPILMPDSPDGFQTIAAGANFTWAAQENAGINSVFISCGNNTTPTVVPLGNDVVARLSGGALVQQFFNYDALNQWLPMLPGTNSIQIFNNTAYALNFGVAYGVEG